MYSLSVIHLFVSLAYEISRHLISCYKTEVYFSGFNPLVLCETWRMKYKLLLRSLFAHYMAKKGEKFRSASLQDLLFKAKKVSVWFITTLQTIVPKHVQKANQKKKYRLFPSVLNEIYQIMFHMVGNYKMECSK